MKIKEAEQQFNSLLQETKSNPDLIGFFLSGSRGKGFEDENSDYDVTIIAKDEVAKKYQAKYGKIAFKDIDLSVMSLAEFRQYAAWCSPENWDRYDFVRVKALVDKTGKVQPLIDKKGSVSKEKRQELIRQSLDAYINSVFRGVKCWRGNNKTGARLEAAASIPYLLVLVFALEGRIRPYYRYLEKELRNYPLRKLPWSNKIFTEMIMEILTTADLKTQQKILKKIEQVFRQAGFGQVFDDWGGKDKWAMNFKK